MDTNKNIEIQLSEIKKDFFKYRNGIIADSIRKLYPSGKVIFGLNVPQFMELIRFYPKDFTLGNKLWKDNSSREARLFSFFIIPPEDIDQVFAYEMIEGLESQEEADLLAFKILRRMPNAHEIYNELANKPFQNPLSKYGMEMFKKNLDSLNDCIRINKEEG